MRRGFMWPIAAAVLMALATLPVAPAAAQSPPAGATGTQFDSGTGDVGTSACTWTPVNGAGGVNVRRDPDTSAPRIGIMYEGQAAFGSCDIVFGGWATGCGYTHQGWRHIYWGNTHGYVFGGCVRYA